MPGTGRRRLSAIAAPLASVLALALPAAPVSAQQAPPVEPVVMICGLDEVPDPNHPGSYTGWVPEIVIVTRQANGRIEVFDPILQQYVGRPIQAYVTADDRRARTYGWALAGVRNRSGQWAERLDFRLTLDKRDSSARMTVQAQDYDNTIAGRGFCGNPRE